MSLLRAEILKLVRRRGLMTWSLLLTVGSVLIAEIVLVSLHAANPAHHGPAGGAENMRNFVFLVAGLGDVAAIIIGSTAGTQDVANGVFRDLVVTGRPRSTLFQMRIAGALSVFMPMLALGFALAIGGSFLLAGDRPKPTWGDVGHDVLYAVLITGINIVIAVGLAAFASSRVVVGVLIAWNAIVSHLLIAIGSLGSVRDGIDVGAAEHFAPHGVANNTAVTMSGATAAIVLIVWAVVWTRAGRFWTNRIDV